MEIVGGVAELFQLLASSNLRSKRALKFLRILPKFAVTRVIPPTISDCVRITVVTSHKLLIHVSKQETSYTAFEESNLNPLHVVGGDMKISQCVWRVFSSQRVAFNHPSHTTISLPRFYDWESGPEVREVCKDMSF